jgi:hypothetical protein
MDYEQQIRRASGGDVKAFVDLTRQFQHMGLRRGAGPCE